MPHGMYCPPFTSMIWPVTMDEADGMEELLSGKGGGGNAATAEPAATAMQDAKG